MGKAHFRDITSKYSVNDRVELNNIYNELSSTCGSGIHSIYWEYRSSLIHSAINTAQTWIVSYEENLRTLEDLLESIKKWSDEFIEIKGKCTDEILNEFDIRIQEIEDRIG